MRQQKLQLYKHFNLGVGILPRRDASLESQPVTGGKSGEIWTLRYFCVVIASREDTRGKISDHGCVNHAVVQSPVESTNCLGDLR